MRPELSSLRRIPRADVYKAGVRAATLEREAGSIVFRYAPGYEGPAVASTLPIHAAPWTRPGGALPPFFAGLLPEGRRLVALRSAVKTSADDELSLLLAVGADTIGDVQVVPEDTPPREADPVLKGVAFDQVCFRDLFRDATGAAIDRVGLPGVQDKISASQMVSFPVDRRYLLKLNPRDVPWLVENEAFFLEQARRCGLDAAKAEIVVDADGETGLLVQRFDRVEQRGEVRRAAQEDACQAAARYPADKYALAAEEAIAALSALTPAPKVAARELVRQVVFAYLTGNGDQHAKNLSVVERGGEMRASPAYDVPSTHPYGDATMALTIDGKDRENITRENALALGAAVGLPPRSTARMIDALLARIPRVIDETVALPFDDRRLHRLRRLMQDRAGKLAE